MSYQKFTVERIENTPSGSYAIYKEKRYRDQPEYEVGTGNFGFRPGDVVEWWDYDGYCPSKIIVNGEVKWTEEDKKKWWDTREARMDAMIEAQLFVKGIYHPKYNPNASKP